METNQQPIIDRDGAEGMRQQLGETFAHVIQMHFDLDDHSPEQYARLETILGTLSDFFTLLTNVLKGGEQ
jgi:hypothetical protein